jgi:hypothetical protein
MKPPRDSAKIVEYSVPDTDMYNNNTTISAHKYHGTTDNLPQNMSPMVPTITYKGVVVAHTRFLRSRHPHLVISVLWLERFERTLGPLTYGRWLVRTRTGTMLRDWYWRRWFLEGSRRWGTEPRGEFEFGWSCFCPGATGEDDDRLAWKTVSLSRIEQDAYYCGGKAAEIATILGDTLRHVQRQYCLSLLFITLLIRFINRSATRALSKKLLTVKYTTNVCSWSWHKDTIEQE